MKKKVLSIFVSTTLSLSLLAGCGNKEEDVGNDIEDMQEVADASTPTVTTTPELPADHTHNYEWVENGDTRTMTCICGETWGGPENKIADGVWGFWGDASSLLTAVNDYREFGEGHAVIDEQGITTGWIIGLPTLDNSLSADAENLAIRAVQDNNYDLEGVYVDAIAKNAVAAWAGTGYLSDATVNNGGVACLYKSNGDGTYTTIWTLVMGGSAPPQEIVQMAGAASATDEPSKTEPEATSKPASGQTPQATPQTTPSPAPSQSTQHTHNYVWVENGDTRVMTCSCGVTTGRVEDKIADGVWGYWGDESELITAVNNHRANGVKYEVLDDWGNFDHMEYGVPALDNSLSEDARSLAIHAATSNANIADGLAMNCTAQEAVSWWIELYHHNVSKNTTVGGFACLNKSNGDGTYTTIWVLVVGD